MMDVVDLVDDDEDEQQEAFSVKENTVNLSQYRFREEDKEVTIVETERETDSRLTAPSARPEAKAKRASKPREQLKTASESASTKAAKPAAKRRAAAAKPAKAKIERDFEKLSAEEQQAFLRKVIPLYNTEPVGEDAPAPAAVAEEVSSSSAEEKELMRLRLALGDVLNREAECRAKEKKLRVAIRKLQRKLATACDAEERGIEQVEDINTVLKSLFYRCFPEMDGESRTLSEGVRCVLWGIAQQREELAALCEEKRVSVERDATLVGAQIESDEPSNAMVREGEDEAGGPSVLSQLLNVMQSSADNDDENKDRSRIDADDSARVPTSSIADEWVEILLEDRQALLRNDSLVKREIQTAMGKIATRSEELALLSRLTEERLAETEESDCAQLRSLLLSRVLQLQLRRLTQSDSDCCPESESAMIIAALCATQMTEVREASDEQTNIARKRGPAECVLSLSSKVECNKRKRIAETSMTKELQGAVCIDLVSPTKNCPSLSQNAAHEENEDISGRSSLLSKLKDVQKRLGNADKPLASTDDPSSSSSLSTRIASTQGQPPTAGNAYASSSQPASFSSSSASSSVTMNSSSNVFGLNFPSLAINSVGPPPLSSSSSTTSSSFAPFSMSTSAAQPAMTVLSASSQINRQSSTRPATSKGPLTAAALKQFLQSHLDIYQDILMFIPISLDDVLSRLTNAGFQITRPALLQLLDSLSVFVSPDYGGRRHK